MATGIDKYLNDILNKIYANQDLCKLLYYDKKNPLAEADIIDTTILRTDKNNQKIFVSPFTIDNSDVVKSTLTIQVNNFSLGKTNIYFKNMDIDFIVVCNVNIWELDDGSGEVKIRVNAIWEELNKIFNRQKTVGLGINNFNYGKITQFNQYFWGYVYSLRAIDFTLN